MDSRLSPPSARFRGPWGVRPWTLAVLGLLLAVGTLIQACSDNNGSTGPTFQCREQTGGPKVLAQCTASPAPTTGFANTSADIRVQVVVNPNAITPGRRAGVTAVVTNANGQPLAGKIVRFSTEVGSLDQVAVETNSQGVASTTLSITATDVANAQGKTSAVVSAVVDGAVGTATVNFGGNAVLVLIPESVTRNVGASGVPPGCANIGSFTATFTVTGGVPPYTFSTSGAFPGASVSGTGVYTAPAFGPVAQNTEIIDTVTVVDSQGNSDSSTVNVRCVQPAT